MGRIKNKDLYPLKLNPSLLDFIVGSDEENDGLTKNFQLSSIVSLVSGAGQQDRIVSGKPIWIPDTLSFYIPTITYYLGGLFYATTPTTITLDNGGAEPRIDVIAVTSEGTVYVEQGVEAPSPLEPSLPNGTDYLQVSFVNVAAGATVPTDASYEQIYLENLGEPTEWNATKSPTSTRIDLDYLSFAGYGGNNKAIRIEQGAQQNEGDQIILTKDSLVDVNLSDSIQLYVRKNTVISGSKPKLEISLYNGATMVSNKINLLNLAFGYTVGLVNDYMTLYVSLSDFTLTGTQYDKIVIEPSYLGYSTIMFIDNITRVIGIEEPVTDIYVLPVATDTVLGGVKIDGSTITIDSEGVISAVSSSLLEIINNPLDVYYGTRLEPKASNNGFYIESGDNKAVGYIVKSLPNTGNGHYAGYVAQGEGTVFQDSTNFGHYGSAYYEPYLRNNSALYSTNTLFILGGRDSSKISFRLGKLSYSSVLQSETDEVLTMASDRTIVAPSLTNALIDGEATGQSLVTKSWVKNILNLQQKITTSFTVSESQNNHTIFINSATPVTVTINSLSLSNFECSFYNLGAGDVTFVAGTGSSSFPDGTVLETNKVCTLLRVEAENNYIVKGELI